MSPPIEGMHPQLEAVHPVLGCGDVARSIRFYAALGFDCVWQDSPTEPKYACIRRHAVELHLQWHASALRDPTEDRPVFRFLVRDVDGLCRAFRARPEVTDLKDAFDTPWGTREFHLRDPDRNGLQFYRPR